MVVYCRDESFLRLAMVLSFALIPRRSAYQRLRTGDICLKNSTFANKKTSPKKFEEALNFYLLSADIENRRLCAKDLKK